MTRTVTHAIPKWRQNILYTIKNQPLEKLAAKVLTLRLVRPTALGESSVGEFSCYLSEVIHSPDRSVIAKWVALGFPGMDDEEPDDIAYENCGFLKVTLSVYRIDESPPTLIDDDGKEQIWSGAHLIDYTLKIRVFSVEQLIRQMINERKIKKKQRFYVMVQCGAHKTETTMESAFLDEDANIASVKFEQEIYLPIQWPTVISEIIFSLFDKKGRGKTCIGKATLPMKMIYEPGETGYLPTFGPAFLNVFDCERVTRFSIFSRKMRGSQQDGSRFVGRLFIAIDCVEYMEKANAQIMHLDHSPIMEAESICKNLEWYNCFCSMSGLNMINPQFASDPVCIMMSIGSFGSTSNEFRSCNSSTLPAEPNWDGCKYFTMPWGNLRPVAEVNAPWEVIEHRIEMSNVLMKMTNMLDTMIWEVRRIGNKAIDHVSSVGMEALECLEQQIDSASKYLGRINPVSSNALDRHILDYRKEKILKLREHFEKEAFSIDYSDGEVDAKLLRMLLKIRSMTLELAEDVQMTIPPVLIKMMSHGKLIGFAKIPISEIFQSDDEAQSGEWCGRTRAINIQWPTLVDQRNRKREHVAVLHAKMWFGRTDQLTKWKEHVQPADIRRFMEMYEVQTKGLALKWKDEADIYDGKWEKTNEVPLENGWNAVGHWIVMNTRHMFVPKLGQHTVHDKAFEIQKRTEDGTWKHFKYTDCYADELKPKDLDKHAKGWEVGSWAQDKFRNNGDEKGWVYSTNGVFFGSGVLTDREEKVHHNFRKRCIKRPRKHEGYNKELEDFEHFRTTMGNENWEYSPSKKEGPYHDLEDRTDRIRRRRYVREVENKDPDSEDPRFRVYEYQMQTGKWQLRCYIMWGNDLLPVVKNSSRAFVRISFAQYSKQTLLVDNSQNPIWNETVMFKSVLIAGGTRDIMKYPPVVSVEVVGECSNNEEANLGHFETKPNVICGNTDVRGTPQWFPLKFSNGRTRGAVLACFELYSEEDKDLIPLEPKCKHNYKERSEIPTEFRPQFDKFHVQFLCWGVRNLKKHKLLAVRRPFVGLTIGDQEFTLQPLKDVRRDPNFPEPMIVFGEVILPSALELSPPLIINLFDARAFNRQPLVGSCLVSDLHKYVSHIVPKVKSDHAERWEQLDLVITEEFDQIIRMVRVPTLTTDPMVPLDWWSRYYASMSQFHRSPGYPESGMEYVRIFRRPLEQMNGYNNFSDFLDTFPFVKSMKGDFDDPEEKEKAGELKCRLLISKLKKGKPPAAINTVVDFVGPTRCLVRVYIIEANGLISNARKGRVDSYVKLHCGKQNVNLKKNYRSECCDPIFGERVDMTVTIPLEKDLKITVMGKRRILSDQEIGSTTIDLENRLLTKWRATGGLSGQFTVQGELQWRDQMTPMEILKSYCYKMMLSVPKIESRQTERGEEKGITIEKITFWFSEVLHVFENEEIAMLNSQRQKAGKENFSDGSDQQNEDVSDGSWDEEDLEREKEKLKWEKHRSKGKPLKKVTTEKAETADGELRKKAKMRIMGSQLQTIALFILRQMNLVPEHVESRPLFSDKGGRTQKGELRMFVDIFPMEYGAIPAPFNIAPRKPINYQLRIAVMDVRGAIPVKRSFAEPVSDLYVKAFINGMTKGHKTDTHFRVLDGTGEFNWRFLLNFDYNPWEKKVVAYTKNRFFCKPVEELVDPILVIELWDKNKFRKDRLLGDIELDLLDFIEGIGSPSDVGVYSTKKRQRGVKCPKCCTRRGCLCKCCIFCFETKCLCGKRKVKKKPFPKPVLFVEPEGYDDTVNIFESRNLYGWWPMLTEEYPHEEPQNAKKKNDDVGKDPKWIMGLVEMDMLLLTKQEADQEPAGKKRSEPNHSPFLEKPDRKSWANSWLVSRIKPCIKYFWHYYGLQILLWLIIIVILILTIFVLLHTWPTILAEIIKAIF
ncbi:C2 domain-containing protein [Caenorhabditis elegans]|nr:C2 domain-containing protein [Caenorhabditis elegans]CAQ35045.1 C2 domain-containing protein [Caenorhabditis elegans]|eukprot:NP_001122477.1 Sperm vesicle fusion protein fer-1 [Caenorhabditis elegans]